MPKTDEIKVRVDPLTKQLLIEIGQPEQLALSDVARRAFRELIQRNRNNNSPWQLEKKRR